MPIQSMELLIFIFACQLLTLGGVSINSSDGDVIDCINLGDQIAFTHPLLGTSNWNAKNGERGSNSANLASRWRTLSTGNNSSRQKSLCSTKKSYPNVHNIGSEQPTAGHQYAIGYLPRSSKIYGTRATLNVWNPVVEGVGDFSLSQIWLASGSYETADLNTVEAGWQVYPSRYSDSQPRLFTYWTANAYNKSGCYGIDCPGFVQTSSSIAIGAAISNTSTYGGTQLDITVQIWKDPVSGNWWFGLGNKIVDPIGYWPAKIFTVLSEYATTVEWRGEVYYRNISGNNTKAEMGSGYFAKKGYQKAAYVCNLGVAEDNYSLVPVQDIKLKADHPKSYSIRKLHNKKCGHHFYFGGPGPQRSGAIHGTTAFYVLVVLGSIFIVISS